MLGRRTRSFTKTVLVNATSTGPLAGMLLPVGGLLTGTTPGGPGAMFTGMVGGMLGDGLSGHVSSSRFT